MIGDRIKMLRKALDLTQQELAGKIGVKRNTIAKYETNRGEPIDAVISLICREFNVSESWLRSGEGEMFAPAPVDNVDALLDSCGLPRFLRGLFLRYAKLPEEAKRELERMITEWAAELSATVPDAETPEERHERHKREARAEAEEYYQEVLAEKTAEEDSSASGGHSGATA